MAYRVLPFTVTIPAGTTKTAPYTQALALDNWELEAVDLEVPAGPNGLMGFQLLNNGVAWLPYGSGQWIVWNDHAERYSLNDQPNGSGWQVQGYNTGNYPHAVTLRFHVNPVSNTATAPVVPTLTVVTTPDPNVVPVVL